MSARSPTAPTRIQGVASVHPKRVSSGARRRFHIVDSKLVRSTPQRLGVAGIDVEAREKSGQFELRTGLTPSARWSLRPGPDARPHPGVLDAGIEQGFALTRLVAI